MEQLTNHQRQVLYQLVQGVKTGKDLQKLGGFAGTGKAQPLHSLIATPTGFVQMRDIKIGDVVSVPNGQTAKIIGVFPQGWQKVFQIHFRDGSVVEASADHLWIVSDRARCSKPYKSSYRVYTTEYMYDRIGKSKGDIRFRIPLPKPVFFVSQPVPLDPYLLGLLIGDGTLGNSIKITSADKEILNVVAKLIEPLGLELKHDKRYDHKLKLRDYVPYRKNPLLQVIKKLGLHRKTSRDKYIPEVFLINDEQTRWSLLQGLMDTDGTVDHRTGSLSYSTKSSLLAQNVKQLVESLGGVASVCEVSKTYTYKGQRQAKKSFICNIRVQDTEKVFRLGRKALLTKPKQRTIWRSICSITYKGEEECQCIMVDHPDHQYLTNNYIRTHNTTIIKYLIKFFPKFKVCSYTGKATNVLRKKGIEASTIHSLIYKPVIEHGVLTGFELNSDLDASGIIIDEASMVSKELYDDLRSFNLPMIFVGDHGQLEPVGSDFNLMQYPNYTLEEIHRNAGDIARFAEHVRKGYAPRSFRSTSDAVVFMDQWKMTPQQMITSNQVICAYNKTRVDLNNQIRQVLGFSGTLNINERIMCLKNNKKLGLFNGMQGFVRALYKKRNVQRMDFEFDGYIYPGIRFDQRFFGKEKTDFKFLNSDSPSPFDYAYVITCHKCVDENTWLYTTDGMIQIKELWPKNCLGRLGQLDLKLATKDETKQSVQIFKGNFEECKQITTNIGCSLTGSLRHPIYVWDDQNCNFVWKKSPELKVGDIVPIRRGSAVFPQTYFSPKMEFITNWRHKKSKIPTCLTTDLALILGYLVGDGHYAKNKNDMVSLTNMDKVVLDKFKTISETMFGIRVKTRIKRGNKAKTSYFISSHVRGYLFALGLNYVVRENKEVPYGVLKSPLDVQQAFLRGLFDTDGSMSSDRGCIRLVNKSKKMISQVQLMLLNMGIISRVKFGAYQTLSISGNDVLLYEKMIGFDVPHKRERLQKHCKRIRGGKLQKTNRDIIPGASKLVNKLSCEIRARIGSGRGVKGQGWHGKLPADCWKMFNRVGSALCNVSYHNLSSMLCDVKTIWPWVSELDAYKKLRELEIAHFYFDTIKTIEDTQCQVYDLSVPDGENFISNGLISHNSQGDEWDRVIVIEQKSSLWNHRRWAYTAASRAMEQLIWVS